MQVAPSGAAFAYGDSEFIAAPPPPSAQPEFVRPAPVAAPSPPAPEAPPQPGARSQDGLDPHAGAPGAGPQPEASPTTTPWAWAGEGLPLAAQGPGMLNALDIAPQIALQLRPQPEIITKPLLISEREPQPTPKPVPTMFGNLDGGLEGSIAFSTKPLQIKSAQTPIAKAAAEVVAEPATTAPAGPTEPKADKMELAALELLLAEPDNQALIKDFGGPLAPVSTKLKVGQAILERYGPDLAARLNQLQHAQEAVRAEYLKAMDSASQAVGPGTPGAVYVPPKRLEGEPERWDFDPIAFTRAYAAGDSSAQKAFAALHGQDPLQYVPPDPGVGEASAQGGYVMAGRQITPGRRNDEDASHYDRWLESAIERPDHQLDPDRITKLIDKNLIWFDPVLGWNTDPKNIKQNWLDRNFGTIVGGVLAVMTAGAASAAMGAASSMAGSVAQGAVTGAVTGATMQVVSTGQLSFKRVLTSALAGGLTAGLTPALGLDRIAVDATLGDRVLTYMGRAGLQGAIQQATGGNFRNGFVNSMLGSVAGEVTAHLNAQISQIKGLDAGSESAMRLLARAAGSAIRALGNPNDPMTGLATDFLSSVMGPEAGQAGTEPITEDPLGDFIAANEQRWADRQAAFDQLIEAFGNPGSEDWGQGEQLAAGAGFNLGASAPASGTLLTADDLRHMEIDGVNASGAADIDLARRALAEIDAVLDHQAGAGPTRAGLYNELVLDRFRDLGSAGQREVLAALDDYANSLHSANENTAVGLTRGSMEARRADLAVRIAADFARQSGAIPDSARFMADARGGVDVGSAAMISAIIGRPVRNRGTGPDVVDGNAPGGRRLPANLSQQDRDAINAIARGPSDVVIVGNGTAPGTRLPQDVNVNSIPPDPMPLLGRPIGSSSTQNAALQADIDYLNSIDVTGSRVNQQQVNGAHSRVGINRPDYQGTLPSGRRIIVEYDTYGSNRGAGHATRVLNNDPNAIVILRRVN